MTLRNMERKEKKIVYKDVLQGYNTFNANKWMASESLHEQTKIIFIFIEESCTRF